MKTDALIALLADGVAPVPRQAARRRVTLGLIAALPLAFLVMLAMLGIRDDLVQAGSSPMFWVKLLFPACVGAAGLIATQRLARPGVRAGAVWVGLVAPLLVVWGLGLWQWSTAPESARSELLWGDTWRTCPFNIAAIAAPILGAAIWALKGLAPTRPVLAGAAAGAMAGGAGAAVYALHCPEIGAPFLAVWYVAGMSLVMAVGAALGPKLLRW